MCCAIHVGEKPFEKFNDALQAVYHELDRTPNVGLQMLQKVPENKAELGRLLEAQLRVTDGHPGGYDNAGKFFGFADADADIFFATTSWHGKSYPVTANGKSANIIVWRYNPNCKMSCGCWDDDTQAAGQWQIGDTIHQQVPEWPTLPEDGYTCVPVNIHTAAEAGHDAEA